MVTKRSDIIKQTSICQMQVCLSMYKLLAGTKHLRFKIELINLWDLNFMILTNTNVYCKWNSVNHISVTVSRGVFITVWKVFVFRVFLVRIFSYSDWIRRDTEYLCVFSPNAGKCGPQKLRRWTLFTRYITLSNIYAEVFL